MRMNTRERLAQRFKQLQGDYHSLNESNWYGWCTNVMHLLKLAFGDASAHLTEFEKIYSVNVGSFSEEVLGWLNSIFLAAKADYDGGYAVRIEASVAGEIFADFVLLAKEALAQKQKDVAAVLACAALEDTLKRIGTANGLDVSEKDMSEVISALKGAGLIKGGAKLLERMPRIRKHAMHAEWENITPEEVASVIGFVEQLILSHFPPS